MRAKAAISGSAAAPLSSGMEATMAPTRLSFRAAASTQTASSRWRPLAASTSTKTSLSTATPPIAAVYSAEPCGLIERRHVPHPGIIDRVRVVEMDMGVHQRKIRHDSLPARRFAAVSGLPSVIAQKESPGNRQMPISRHGVTHLSPKMGGIVAAMARGAGGRHDLSRHPLRQGRRWAEDTRPGGNRKP